MSSHEITRVSSKYREPPCPLRLIILSSVLSKRSSSTCPPDLVPKMFRVEPSVTYKSDVRSHIPDCSLKRGDFFSNELYISSKVVHPPGFSDST